MIVRNASRVAARTPSRTVIPGRSASRIRAVAKGDDNVCIALHCNADLGLAEVRYCGLHPAGRSPIALTRRRAQAGTCCGWPALGLHA